MRFCRTHLSGLPALKVSSLVALLVLSASATVAVGQSIRRSDGRIFDTDDIHAGHRRLPERSAAIKKIGPSEADRQAYKGFLRGSKTGITRLVFQVPCHIPQNERLKDVRKSAEECPTHFIFGNGSSFSFRRRDYAFATQADVTIKGNIVYSMGTLAQGIMVRLGNRPLEEISLDEDGVSFLKKLVPATTPEAADSQGREFDKGLVQGNFRYARGFKIEADTTFALRVVAYKADLAREVKLSEEKLAALDKASRNLDPRFRDSIITEQDTIAMEDPLAGDERVDIIVAFRIIRIDPDGSVTLVWKELKRAESPKFARLKE